MRSYYSLIFSGILLLLTPFGGNGATLEPRTKKKTLVRPPPRRNIQVPNDKSTQYPPTWETIISFPAKIDSKEKFQALPYGKRLGIAARASVLHLTYLSCFGPLVVRGALAAASNTPIKLTPGLNLLWTINVISWHACHNMINDWQDCNDDDADQDSYRRSYGVHPLREGYMSKAEFLQGMLLVSLPAIVISTYFLLQQPTLSLATFLGIVSMLAYTPLFKPFALGELLIYFVWGPLMAGYGTVAAGGDPITTWSQALLDPMSALFGLFAVGTIFGKHTDKIQYSNKNTLPKLLGYPAALVACGLVTILPHIILLAAYMRSYQSGTQLIPYGASLAFLTLFKEVPAVFKILRLGPVTDNKPTVEIGTVMRGNVVDAIAGQGWPLWFVGFCAWHAVTFGYLMLTGSGLEWMGRAIYNRFLN